MLVPTYTSPIFPPLFSFRVSRVRQEVDEFVDSIVRFMVRHHRSRYIRRTVVGSRCREVDVAALVRAQ